jgi:hypothetical protein
MCRGAAVTVAARLANCKMGLPDQNAPGFDRLSCCIPPHKKFLRKFI